MKLLVLEQFQSCPVSKKKSGCSTYAKKKKKTQENFKVAISIRTDLKAEIFPQVTLPAFQ